MKYFLPKGFHHESDMFQINYYEFMNTEYISIFYLSSSLLVTFVNIKPFGANHNHHYMQLVTSLWALNHFRSVRLYWYFQQPLPCGNVDFQSWQIKPCDKPALMMRRMINDDFQSQRIGFSEQAQLNDDYNFTKLNFKVVK